MPHKCECPTLSSVRPGMQWMYSEEEKSGMDHEPNECQGTNKVKLYRRDKKELWLCSCCSMVNDEEVI